MVNGVILHFDTPHIISPSISVPVEEEVVRGGRGSLPPSVHTSSWGAGGTAERPNSNVPSKRLVCFFFLIHVLMTVCACLCDKKKSCNMTGEEWKKVEDEWAHS